MLSLSSDRRFALNNNVCYSSEIIPLRARLPNRFWSRRVPIFLGRHWSNDALQRRQTGRFWFRLAPIGPLWLALARFGTPQGSRASARNEAKLLIYRRNSGTGRSAGRGLGRKIACLQSPSGLPAPARASGLTAAVPRGFTPRPDGAPAREFRALVRFALEI